MQPEDIARTLYASDASAVALGIELLDADADGAVVRMPVRPEMCNGFAIAHGGMTFLLADSAMAFASNAEGQVALATSAEIDWLAPVRAGQTLTARAAKVWSSGRSALWDITVTVDDGTVVARFRGRTRKMSQTVVDAAAATLAAADQANSEPR